MIAIKSGKRVIHVDLPKLHPITKKTIASIKKRCGGVRVVMPRGAFERRRKRVLEHPIP